MIILVFVRLAVDVEVFRSSSSGTTVSSTSTARSIASATRSIASCTTSGFRFGARFALVAPCKMEMPNTTRATPNRARKNPDQRNGQTLRF